MAVELVHHEYAVTATGLAPARGAPEAGYAQAFRKVLMRVPVGELLVQRVQGGVPRVRALLPVRFVPMTGGIDAP